MRRTDIDAREVRKHTHLAGVDVEIMLYKQEEVIVTIKTAWEEKNVEVSGNKMERGIFCDFEELDKPMVVNPTKAKIIAGFLKADGLSDRDANNLQSWVGLKLSLLYDPTIKMMGQTKGGIRISPLRPVVKKAKPIFTEANFENAKKAKATIEMIEKTYLISDKLKAKYLLFYDEAQ
jgi:hypothetical protein